VARNSSFAPACFRGYLGRKVRNNIPFDVNPVCLKQFSSAEKNLFHRDKTDISIFSLSFFGVTGLKRESCVAEAIAICRLPARQGYRGEPAYAAPSSPFP